MTFWSKVKLLPFSVLCQMYGDEISLDLRHHLSEWIEYTFTQWLNIDINNASYTASATATLDDLLVKIVEKIESFGNQEDKFLPKLNLQIAAENLNKKYRNNPLSLIGKIRSCILQERQLLFPCEYFPQPENRTRDNEDEYQSAEIISELEVLRLRTIEISVSLSQLRSNKNNYDLLSSTLVSFPEGNHLAPDIPMEPSFELSRLTATLSDLQKTFEDTLYKLTATQERILNVDLIKWKKEQRLAVNDEKINIEKLTEIQNFCEMLVDILILTRNQIQEYEKYKPQTHNDYLLPRVNELFCSLVEKTFIIENEPPQVMMKGKIFEVTASLLVGNKLNYYLSPPNVCVKFINQNQAKTFLSGHEGQSGNIENNIGTMKFDESNKRHSITLNMRLITKEGNGTGSVSDKKFALLFEAKFSIDGGTQKFNLRKLSLPIVVIVHASQEPRALSTILWDNEFSESTRVPFDVPMNAPWPKIAEMLNRTFNSETTNDLTDENLEFLASIAFQRTPNNSFNQNMLTYTEFCKENLPGRNFTFWQWYYGVIKVISNKHVHELWKKNAIKGFIEKTKAEYLLKQCSQGTFLLRFSESEIGGITLAWVKDGFIEGHYQKIVKNLQPFHINDLVIRSLADRIKDYDFLENLYPNKPKNQVFGDYYSKENYETDKDLYTFHELISVVRGYPRLPDIDFDTFFSFP